MRELMALYILFEHYHLSTIMFLVTNTRWPGRSIACRHISLIWKSVSKCISVPFSIIIIAFAFTETEFLYIALFGLALSNTRPCNSYLCPAPGLDRGTIHKCSAWQQEI